MRRRSVAFLVAAGLIAASCNSSNGPSEELSPTAAQSTTPTAATEDPPVDDAAAYQSGDSALIFDQERLHSFQLDLAPELLAELDADPTAEEYVEGTLTFAGETLPVGIRYKGSVGAFVGCLSGSNIFEPSGEKTCTKLSLKVDKVALRPQTIISPSTRTENDRYAAVFICAVLL